MPATAPNSPCINACNLDADGCCRGCYRTREEIATWTALGAAAQWSVVLACAARRAAREFSYETEGN